MSKKPHQQKRLSLVYKKYLIAKKCLCFLPLLWISEAKAIDWQTRLPITGWYSWQNYSLDPTMNPGNQIYRLYDHGYTMEFRPDITLSQDEWQLQLSPRLVANQYQGKSDNLSWHDDDFDLRLRYAKLQYASGNNYAKWGRYVNLWGPSVIVSPSNPFYVDTGQSMPQAELAARDYAELGHFFGAQHSLNFIYNYGKGNQSIANFKPIQVLRYSYTGDEIAQNLLVMHHPGRWSVGNYGQWTLNDSVLLYWDGLLGQQSKIDTLALAQNELRQTNHSAWRARALAGGSYSFIDGTTLALEYYYNGVGLTEDEAQSLYQLQGRAIASLVNPTQSSSSAEIVSQIGNIPFGMMGRQYVIARLQRSNLWDQLDLALIHMRNLNDQSGETILRADWYATDSLQLFSILNLFNGASHSEFGRFLNSQFSLGFRWTY